MSAIEEKPLRHYQIQSVDEVRGLMASGLKRVCMQIPTGGGKTRTAAHIVERAATRGKRVLWLAHRDFLIEQAYNTLKGYRLDPGVILGGIAPSHAKPIQVASVQSLVNRLDKFAKMGDDKAGNNILSLYGKFDLIVIDEAHRVAANTYQKILAYQDDPYVLGLTATPCRLDGKGLKDSFDALSHGLQILDLVEQGFLVPPKYIGAPTIDITGVEVSHGDYVKKQLIEATRRSQINGSTVETWMKHAYGLQTIVFCADVELSKQAAQEYIGAGIKAAHVDGNTDKAVRKAILQAFGQREITVLTNCGLFSEGLDIPGIECVQMLRRSLSTVFNYQAVGRCLRPDGNKTHGLILDHVDAAENFNVMDLKIWELETTKKKRKRELTEADKEEIREAEKREIYIDELIELVELSSDYEQEWTKYLRSLVAEVIARNYKKSWIHREFVRRYPNPSMEMLKRVAKTLGYNWQWAKHRFDELNTGKDVAA